MSTTITLSRAERAVVLDEIGRLTREGRDPHEFNTRAEATATLDDLHCAFDLLEELDGWPGRGHAGETFTVTITSGLVELLRVTQRETSESLAYERGVREKIVQDEPGWRWPEVTVEDNIAQHDQILAGAEKTVRVCADLLARIEQQAVTA